MALRVLVTGSRALVNPTPVYDALYSQAEAVGGLKNLTVVHGDANMGADSYARHFCYKHPDVTEERYPANWEALGKAAGHIRNKQMVDTRPNLVLAFLRGEAKGTWNCVQHAKHAGIPVIFG